MKNKVLLKFPADQANTPITYELVKQYDLKINILRASINYNMKGSLLMDIEGTSENFAKALKYLEHEGIDADFVHPIIRINHDTCVDCGICTSVCASRALTLSDEDASLEFIQERCVGCNLCLKVCPTQSISI